MQVINISIHDMPTESIVLEPHSSEFVMKSDCRVGIDDDDDQSGETSDVKCSRKILIN